MGWTLNDLKEMTTYNSNNVVDKVWEKGIIIKNKTIDKIEIIIRAEDKTLINFNNIDWTLKLKIDITRKYNISDKSNENNIKKLKSNDVIKNDLDLLTYK